MSARRDSLDEAVMEVARRTGFAEKMSDPALGNLVRDLLIRERT